MALFLRLCEERHYHDENKVRVYYYFILEYPFVIFSYLYTTPQAVSFKPDRVKIKDMYVYVCLLQEDNAVLAPARVRARNDRPGCRPAGSTLTIRPPCLSLK